MACTLPEQDSVNLRHVSQQHLDNLRRKDSLRGAETTEVSVRLGNYSASHFDGSASPQHAEDGKRRRIGWPPSTCFSRRKTT